jgi:hypothetical protein
VLPTLAIPAIGLKEYGVDAHLVGLGVLSAVGAEMLASIAVPSVGTGHLLAGRKVDFGGWSGCCTRA